jgi:hypothetical protein
MRFKYDPVGFVNYAFPWGEEHKPLAEIKGLRKWRLGSVKNPSDTL